MGAKSAEASNQIEIVKDTSQDTIVYTVEKSDAAQARALQGTTVISDEDVTIPRTHFGGEYHDVSTSE